MKTKILYLFLIVSTSIYSQTTEPIQADRPDQTETPAIVPKGMFQVETGFTFQKNDAFSKSFSLPTTLWKYGVNDNFELRLITEFDSEIVDNEKWNGLAPIYIGFKVKLAEEKGVIPKTSFIAHIGLPNAASSKYKTDYFAPEFRFVMQHTLSEKFSLSYNLGAEWDGFTAQTTFLYTLTTGYSINEKLGYYIEIFGFAPQNKKANHNLDGGFTYLINNNFMVDLSSGIGLTNNAPLHYFACGFSIRI
ncbi:transporter [Flavobacterium sp.]|uniref:transporter n=1 Tax=Flavobacterium sp. TaxID=239 RepID=UPI003BDE4235